jgi:hypothetical protein
MGDDFPIKKEDARATDFRGGREGSYSLLSEEKQLLPAILAFYRRAVASSDFKVYQRKH